MMQIKATKVRRIPLTLIELYDKSPLKNIIGILSLCPDKVYFVGPAHPMLDDVDRVTAVLAAKVPNLEAEIHTINLADPAQTRKTLTEILCDEPDCIIETTGGDERLLLIADELARQHGLQSQHFDIPSGKATDTDGDGTLMPTSPASLSVQELITLHGGTVTGYTSSPACDKDTIDILWALTCHHPREWNSHLKFLVTIEKHHCHGQTVSMPAPTVPKFDKTRFANIRAKFAERGIIRNESTPKEIRYTYTSPHLRGVLEKAGNILEHKALYEAMGAQVHGTPLFDDCCMGVEIDWDNDLPAAAKNTNNEIDLLLVRGVQPLFVSCKNGDVDENELYKLAIVAERFGGEYARKMLIATELEPDSPQAREAFARRAEDMGIHLVANAGHLTPDEWEKEYLKAMGLQ